MSRKDTLRAMLSHRDERLPSGNSGGHTGVPTNESLRSVSHLRSGAVGAMGRSLGQIAHAAEQAKALIASGASVIEVSPEVLDASFVSDRLDDEGAEFEKLHKAIKASGQRSPILIRPHPENSERYQIVFGHRRVRVATRLGCKVRAVVQNLTDEELVVIQGQENSARADLSYIERGLFAIALEERGFDRRVIMAALNMEKTQLSKLLTLAHSVPRNIIAAIGAAPKAGRPRWSALAARLDQVNSRETLEVLFLNPQFAAADSDKRFLMVFDAVAPKGVASRARSATWRSDDGRKIATIHRAGARLAILVHRKDAPDFGEFVVAQLPVLHQQFRRQREEGIATKSDAP